MFLRCAHRVKYNYYTAILPQRLLTVCSLDCEDEHRHGVARPVPRSLHTSQALRGFTPSSPGASLPALAGLGPAPVCSIAAAVSRSHTRRTALSLRRSAAVKTCGGGAPPPPDPDAATTPSESEVMAVSSAAAARSPCGTAPCGAHALSTRQSTRAHGKCRRTRGHTARRSARARATPRCSARARALPHTLESAGNAPAGATLRAHGVPAAERRKSLPRLPPRSVEHGARPLSSASARSAWRAAFPQTGPRPAGSGWTCFDTSGVCGGGGRSGGPPRDRSSRNGRGTSSRASSTPGAAVEDPFRSGMTTRAGHAPWGGRLVTRCAHEFNQSPTPAHGGSRAPCCVEPRGCSAIGNYRGP
jgi:hypothetical protein